MKKIIFSVALSLILPAFVFAYFQPATLTNGVDRVAVFSQEVANKYFGMGFVLEGIEKIGSAAGNTFEQRVNFYRGFIGGGKTYSASSTLTVARTLTAAEIFNNDTITVNGSSVAGTAGAASLDVTLPATSTLWGYLKNEGDEWSFDFINQSPTTASTTEIVAGAGCSSIVGVADGDATIPGQKGATITIKRIKDWLADGGSKDCIVRILEWN
jgi:hypothetical protein